MVRHFDDLMLGTIELFCCVAELGSFTKAADKIGISPAAVSKTIRRLEERLSTKLFNRTTRRVFLTKAGECFVQKCQEALTLLYSGEMMVKELQTTPTGDISINIQNPYCYFRLLPILSKFHHQYPQIKINLHISQKYIAFQNNKYDLSIVDRLPDDNNLVARKLEDTYFVIVASPEYLKKSPPINCLEDLKNHTCIQFQFPGASEVQPWVLMINNKSTLFQTQGNIICHDEALGGLHLALAGSGIFIIYDFAANEYIQQGKLIKLLPQHCGAIRTYYLVYPPENYHSLRMKLFIDFLLTELRR